MPLCKTIGCVGSVSHNADFCDECTEQRTPIPHPYSPNESEKLSEKYPQYYKPVGELTEIDVYAVHHLFNIQDPAGCIQHSSKKLLLSGVRTGGKSSYEDIKEARDTLTRWLQLNYPRN